MQYAHDGKRMARGAERHVRMLHSVPQTRTGGGVSLCVYEPLPGKTVLRCRSAFRKKKGNGR